jgi:hypothetical protein
MKNILKSESADSARQRNLVDRKLPDAATWLEMVSKMWGPRRRKTIRRRPSLHAEDGVVLLCRNSLRRWQTAVASAASGARRGRTSGMETSGENMQ